MTATTHPQFSVTSDGWKNLPKMPDSEYPGTDGYIGDVYENPSGSVMCSGFFELVAAEEPLLYEYTYDEMKIVLEGEFHLENADTGQRSVARAKDAIFFPKGSRILFSTPDRALAFYTGHRTADGL
ncbi:cupin domain-containing protein [Mycobacterium kyogaense]|uniref:cupin domain-containing protein n=1 Tax=Mycobacterium kyogaense TaxID=2212479 RepID=UPI000DAD6817|nr:ethanolamine utilization protein [Mycobacterium kyogaense]